MVGPGVLVAAGGLLQALPWQVPFSQMSQETRASLMACTTLLVVGEEGPVKLVLVEFLNARRAAAPSQEPGWLASIIRASTTTATGRVIQRYLRAAVPFFLRWGMRRR